MPKLSGTIVVFHHMKDINTSSIRYSNSDLQEFKKLILAKRDIAKQELEALIDSLSHQNPNGTDDTGSVINSLEDGSATLEKETLQQMAARQKRFIEQLDAALARIENKTYGICRVTGKLIPRERLLAVPHTTLSIEAKMKQSA